MTTQKKLDEAANNYGTDNFRRRIVSINSCVKADDGTYIFIGTSKVYGSMRDTKTKINRIRRHTNLHIMNDGSGSLVGCMCG